MDAESRFSVNLDTMTMDGLPGSGIWGSVLQAMSKPVVGVSRIVAHQLGYGPKRAHTHLKDTLTAIRRGAELNRVGTNWVELGPQRLHKLYSFAHKQCLLLQKYVRNSVPSNQYDALKAIVDIRAIHPSLSWDIFQEHDLAKFVAMTRNEILHIDELIGAEEREWAWRRFYEVPFDESVLSSLVCISHKALLCVEDNALNRLLEKLSAMYNPFSVIADELKTVQHSISAPSHEMFFSHHKALLEYLYDPALHFLAYAFLNSETLIHPSRIPRRARMGVYIQIYLLYRSCEHVRKRDYDQLGQEIAKVFRTTGLFLSQEALENLFVHLFLPSHTEHREINDSEIMELVNSTVDYNMKLEVLFELARLTGFHRDVFSSEWMESQWSQPTHVLIGHLTGDHQMCRRHVRQFELTKKIKFLTEFRCRACGPLVECTHGDAAFEEYLALVYIPSVLSSPSG